MYVLKFQRKQIYFTLSIFLILTSHTSCLKNKSNADVSNITINLTTKRFETDLFNTDLVNFNKSASKLQRKYPEFYQLFVENIVRLGRIEDSAYLNNLKDFVSNKDINTLKKDCDSIFSDLKPYQYELKQSFKYVKYYFPKADIPEIVTFVSGFNNAIVNTETSLGLGLDMFLGRNYRYYPSAGFPQFVIKNLHPKAMVPTAIKGFTKFRFEENAEESRLLYRMVYEGKILYFMDKVLPETDDSLKIGFTKKQMEWCKTYEKDIWANFISQKLLFSTDRLQTNKYLDDAPFTSGLDNESSPMLGVWVGWQIVRNYMENASEVSLAQLMAEKDAEKILKISGYKP